MKDPIYVLFGCKGLIGTGIFVKLCETIPDFRIFSFEHAHIDVSNKQQVKEILDFIQPTVVINAAGVSNPELCQQAVSGAFETNAVAPKYLAELCSEIKAKLVHFSSHAVFDGSRFAPYSERCRPNPINELGKSKANGEHEIRKVWSDHLIIRPGWAFSADGPNIVPEWIDRMDKGLSITVPANIHGSPIFVPDLADAVLDLIDRDAKGTFHIANSNAATWESFAEAVIILTKGKAQVRPMSPLVQSKLPPMPRYSVLSCKKYAALTGVELRPWPSALKQCLFQMERYKP